MQGLPEDYKVNVYGDGSLTSPTLWWAALGGYGIWVPKWNDDGREHSNDREEASYYGPALGQTGTSTRQELTAWIRVLAIRCRSLYATDSASMLRKAKRLIAAAERDQKEKEQGNEVIRGNPFGKPWGLQVDGDLWEQAWVAVNKRGCGNQDLRKVKGHATEQDVAQGIATIEDKKGNDASDTLADIGVEAVAGKGLVKLGKWFEKRHAGYRKLMVRVQRMIAGVTIAEKEERKKYHTVQKALLGYDPEKFLKTDAEIRDEDQEQQEYQRIAMIPPTKGKHRFSHCQAFYEEVHAFLKVRAWAPAQTDSEIAGVTWIELFALFDITGNRSEAGQHVKNPAAIKRAEKRRAKARCSRAKKLNISESCVVAKPTLDEEIKQFKAIVRHTTRHEAEQKAAKWFQSDTRSRLRRLGKLGVNGHQPSIMVSCQMSKQGKNDHRSHPQAKGRKQHKSREDIR